MRTKTTFTGNLKKGLLRDPPKHKPRLPGFLWQRPKGTPRTDKKKGKDRVAPSHCLGKARLRF